MGDFFISLAYRPIRKNYMKKLFFTAIAIVFTLCITAQTRESLEPKVAAFHSYLINNDIDKFLDNSYPKTFLVVPRATLKEALISAYSSPEAKVTFLKTDPEFAYGEIKKVGAGHYCLITYNQRMKIVLRDHINDVEGFKAAMIRSMGAENATFYEDENALVLDINARIIAAADSYSNNEWTFMLNDKVRNDLMKAVLGDEILKALGL